jgi:hypothetical protein
LIGAVWLISSSTVYGQEKSKNGTGYGKQMNMGDMTNAEGFQHVHALAMDSDGRNLLLGAHTGVSASTSRSVHQL